MYTSIARTKLQVAGFLLTYVYDAIYYIFC